MKELDPDEWDDFNADLYDIIMASITCTDVQLTHVRTNFAPTLDGFALLDWVTTHACAKKLSAQLELKEKITALSVDDHADPTAVKLVLDTIGQVWPKITDYDHANVNSPINYTLQLFPSSHYAYPYVAALQTQIDLAAAPLWPTFQKFADAFLERIKTAYLRGGVQQTVMVAKRTACSTCDISYCEGADKCVVIKSNVPVGNTPKSRTLVSYLQAYAKEKNLSSMKGVRPPSAWFEQHKRKIKDAAAASSSTTDEPADVCANATPAIDMDQSFWDTIGDMSIS